MSSSSCASLIVSTLGLSGWAAHSVFNYYGRRRDAEEGEKQEGELKVFRREEKSRNLC